MCQAQFCMIFNSSTLVYECQDPEAVRHSISLDFHNHTMADDVLELMTSLDTTKIDLERIVLSDLFLASSVPNYSNHFHRLLSSPDSLKTIFSKVSDIGIPPTKPIFLLAHRRFLQRLDAFESVNQSHIPPNILGMQQVIGIRGTHACVANFLKEAYLKARRDIHVPFGWDLFS
jgi:hypothetical protein